MKRKICIITGSRSEFGLLRWVMEGIREDPDMTLQIIVTGMHLSPEYGMTYKEIEGMGFPISWQVEMLLSSDTQVGVTKSMGVGMIGFADALFDLKPDLVVVLGDRFEIFTAVAAALIARIPVAHIHGGEASEGAVDEAFRHSITKMSHLHFVAADEYRKRVIQLGEEPEKVFLVGGLGIDSIKKLRLLDRRQLEEVLDFKFLEKNLLITFHPATLEKEDPGNQVRELLSALSTFDNTGLIFTLPNADSENRVISRLIKQFVDEHSNARFYTSLGQIKYLSCINQVDAVIGNSSSGLIEVPSFKKGTINIGNRQQGRLKASSVIDCLPVRENILASIKRIYTTEFQLILSDVVNPYGEGGASEKIVRIIKDIPLSDIQRKRFFKLEVPF